MEQITEAGRLWRLVLVSTFLAILIAGCATTASYRPEIESMKAALAEAKSAGAETLAPEEYAHAEACLDWLTHEATEFHPFADPTARNVIGKCRAAFQALKSKLTVVSEAKVPVVPVSPLAAPKPEAAAAEEARKPGESPLKDIFFDFDKSLIRADAKKSLDENVRWLKVNPKATILIEGHCDERGTVEYNQGLGQRRAKSTWDYLAAAGIGADRIKIISYGKERPFALGHDESAWKWNRRAHFVLQ